VIRGGGVGGGLKNDLKLRVDGVRRLQATAGGSTGRGGLGKNSNRFSSNGKDVVRSDLFPAAICLQRGHGCFPSKVRLNATGREVTRRLSASIVVQAMDCSTSQCDPIAPRSATTIINWPSLRNTGAMYDRANSRSQGARAAGFRVRPPINGSPVLRPGQACLSKPRRHCKARVPSA
jgi:hypothetical protein